MAQLSELVALFRKSQAPATPRGPRTSARQRSPRGVTRGALGAYGSRAFKGRNSEAGSDKEREMMNSPIFKAFLAKFNPSTPITDYIAGGTNG